MGAGYLSVPPLGADEAWTKRITSVTGGWYAVRRRKGRGLSLRLGLNPGLSVPIPEPRWLTLEGQFPESPDCVHCRDPKPRMVPDA